METHALTVLKFPGLEEILAATSPGEAIPMPPSVSSTGSFSYYMAGLYRAQSKELKILGGIAAVGGAIALLGLTTTFSEPITAGPVYKLLTENGLGGAAMIVSSAMLLIGGVYAMMAASNVLYQRSRKNRSQKLKEDGFIFASELEGNLLPLQVEKTKHFPVRVPHPNGRTFNFEDWYAVKPNGSLIAYTASLDSLPTYIDQVVITRGQLSSTPTVEDMAASLGLYAHLEGSMMGLPLSGSITGQATGPVSAPKRFRLLDPATGISAAVVVDAYVPDNGVVPPYELRIISPDFGINKADPNRLVQSLAEARRLGSPVTVIGKVDTSGQIHAEAIEVSGRRETYFLSVYEKPPLLKSG